MTMEIIFHEYKIEIPIDSRKYKILYYADIVYIVYDNPYCSVYCVDNKHYMVSYSLSKFIKILPPIFYQCNKFVIINMSRISEYSLQGEGNTIIMDNEHVFSLSRRKKKEFLILKNSVLRLTPPFEQCLKCSQEGVCCALLRAKLVQTE
jgi:DNA-binding LytR/AlgR family response regulator